MPFRPTAAAPSKPVFQNTPNEPKSLSGALFNTAAGLAGLPGVKIPAPQMPVSELQSPRGAGLPSDYEWTGWAPEYGPPRSNFSSAESNRGLPDNGYIDGLQLLNSLGQSAVGPLDGNLRLHVYADKEGKLQGEGDLLLPLLDTTHMSVFTQAGLRSMWDDPWIGNLGVGQRWYPSARKENGLIDSGNRMIGYNAYFDYDLPRSHQRGGGGVETPKGSKISA